MSSILWIKIEFMTQFRFVCSMCVGRGDFRYDLWRFFLFYDNIEFTQKFYTFFFVVAVLLLLFIFLFVFFFK